MVECLIRGVTLITLGMQNESADPRNGQFEIDFGARGVLSNVSQMSVK